VTQRAAPRRASRAVLITAGVAALSVGLAALPGVASSSNPADTQLDRARTAIRNYEFRGTVRIWWRELHGGGEATMPVVAADGALKVDDGRLLADDGRTWMRAGKGWTTLWSDPHESGAPSVARKYTVQRRSGPVIVARPTRLLVVRRHGRAVERIAFDQSTGLVLSRDRFDSSGAPTMRMQFLTLTDLHPRRGDLTPPTVPANAPGTRQAVPEDTPKSLAGGFMLVDARRGDDHADQLRYSDGVFEASVFTEDGPLDWDSLPAGGRDVHYGTVRTRQYQNAAGTVVVWEAGGRTFTCVTDATGDDQTGIIESLSRANDSNWTDVVRFVTSPFSWS
jgi:hypothetical protein